MGLEFGRCEAAVGQSAVHILQLSRSDFYCAPKMTAAKLAPEDAGEDQLQKRLKEEAKKFPEPPNRRKPHLIIHEVTQIRPHLLLCGAVALRGNTLLDLGVTAVVNATQELPDTPLPGCDMFYLRVAIGDTAQYDILSWLDIAADLIHQVHMGGGKTLIHCVAGISRSASLCLAYLVKYEGLSLLDAYHQLKALRQIVKPNAGFFGQLVEFERRVSGRQSVAMLHSESEHIKIPHLEDYTRGKIRICDRV